MLGNDRALAEGRDGRGLSYPRLSVGKGAVYNGFGDVICKCYRPG